MHAHAATNEHQSMLPYCDPGGAESPDNVCHDQGSQAKCPCTLFVLQLVYATTSTVTAKDDKHAQPIGHISHLQSQSSKNKAATAVTVSMEHAAELAAPLVPAGTVAPAV